MKIHDIFHLDLLTLYREMLSYSTNYIRPPPVTEESANSFPFNHHHLGIPLGIPHDPYCCWFLCSHSTLCPIHLLLPEHTVKLLPWYRHWLNKLAAEMCLRCLQRKAPAPVCPLSLSPCTCDSEWHCEPHNLCFIHDSCFCPGSGSFPPVKPPHTSLLFPPS